jgi:hypothetical protein
MDVGDGETVAIGDSVGEGEDTSVGMGLGLDSDVCRSSGSEPGEGNGSKSGSSVIWLLYEGISEELISDTSVKPVCVHEHISIEIVNVADNAIATCFLFTIKPLHSC